MQVFTSVLVLSVFFVVFILSDIESYKKRKAASVNSLAHVIAINSASAIQFRDNETAAGILSDLKDIAPDIVHAVIFNKEGHYFASYSKKGVDSTRFKDLYNYKKSGFAGNQLFVVGDINDQEELVGKLTLQVELTELDEIKKERYRLVTVLLAGSIALSFLVAYVVQYYISRRLLYLVNTMKEVGRTGNYVTVKDDAKDEIGSLIQAFNMLMIEIKDSQQKKDEFISIASHELRTPLTTIKGYLDLIIALDNEKAQKQFIQKSLQSVLKLERLINDLLDVSRIQSGQLRLNLTEFDVEQLLSETIESLQMVLPAHKIIRGNSLNKVIIHADKQRIEQVLINLLSNAVKYSPGEDKVLVSSKQVDSQLVIAIRDFGIGIQDDELLHIFERFYRSKNSTGSISGFGLGLYICRDIIKRHHGEIWVEKEEKGSTFFVSLPLQKNSLLSQQRPDAIIGSTAS